jgi:hypothetical protein
MKKIRLCVGAFAWFFIFSLAMELLFNGWDQNIVEASIVALKDALFYIFISIVLILPVHLYLEKQPGNNVPILKQITIEVPYSEAFEGCIQSLEIVGKHKIIKKDQENGFIHVKRGWIPLTPEEDLTYTLQRVSDTQTLVVIESKTFGDDILTENFRKNTQNVENLVEYINKLRPQRTAV